MCIRLCLLACLLSITARLGRCLISPRIPVSNSDYHDDGNCCYYYFIFIIIIHDMRPRCHVRVPSLGLQDTVHH